MADKFDSTKWTGDYPKRAHIALNSKEGRRAEVKIVRNVLAAIAVLILAGVLAQVFL